MNPDILQSTLDNLSHLLIPPSRITLENGVELGVGGYGQVFLAVLGSPDSQTKVAVKQLRIVQALEVRRRVAIVSLLSALGLFTYAYWPNKRLARELQVWAKAKHPNILALLGFYLSDDYLCAQLVSEYMANGNVKEYINKLQPDLATRLRFTNVLVNESLDAVLCDFGLATFIMESGVSSGLTTSKSPKGSTRYMSPELLDDEAKHTLESDVWAWACTTFEVLTNSEPFPEAKADRAIIMALVFGRTPGSVDLLDSLVSSSHTTCHLTLDCLKSIIPGCWIMDSAKRPSSSEISDRLIFPDEIKTSDIATASSHLSATEDRQTEPYLPPDTDSPTHGNVKRDRKGTAELEGRLARGKNASIETEGVRMQKGYGEGAILMKGHQSPVRICQWNPLKREVLATSSVNGEIRLWNVPVPPAPLLDPVPLKHHRESAYDCYFYAMEWDCTGAWLTTGCNHGVLRVWSAKGALQSYLDFHASGIYSIMWSPSALFLLSASADGAVVVWDMKTRKREKIYQVFRFHSDSVFDALWFDDETLISCGVDGQIHICRLHKKTPLRTFTDHEEAVLFLRLSKDKTLLASSSYDLTIRVWNMDAVEAAGPAQSPTGQTDPAQKWVLRGHTEAPTSLGWCPSLDPAMQYLLVSTSYHNTSRIWDARNGSCIKELLDHRDGVWTHAFSPRGRYLATGSHDGRVLIYSATGTLLFEWDCQSGRIIYIQWQSAGDQLAACLKNGGVAILDTKKMGLGDYVAS
ncbi:hypothetical protein FRC05_003865 [Tulasnella sp. 425]|nr:hypothetical protein FRC05_003865 [Tulasnella sp. 425]